MKKILLFAAFAVIAFSAESRATIVDNYLKGIVPGVTTSTQVVNDLKKQDCGPFEEVTNSTPSVKLSRYTWIEVAVGKTGFLKYGEIYYKINIYFDQNGLLVRFEKNKIEEWDGICK